MPRRWQVVKRPGGVGGDGHPRPWQVKAGGRTVGWFRTWDEAMAWLPRPLTRYERWT